MKNQFAYSFLLLVILSFTRVNTYAQSSVLATNEWYKIKVDKQGVYKLDYSLLKSVGLDVDNINPKNIQLYGNGGKVLPQSNNESRPLDLIQNSIQVIGEEDGKFNNRDYILFYATNIDSTYFDLITDSFIYKNHPYEESAYYFLTVGITLGKRLTNEVNQGRNFPKIDSYNYYEIYEEDKMNILSSGREWYGDQFSDQFSNHTYPFTATNLDPNGNITITSSVMAQSFANSSFDISLNGSNIGGQEISGVTTYQYGQKGRNNTATFETPIDQINNNRDTWNVELAYNKNDSDKSIGYTNFIVFQADRLLISDNKQFNFRAIKSLDNPFSTFEILGMNDKKIVWDVTIISTPKLQEYNLSGSSATYGVPTMELKEYVVFNHSTAFSPITVEPLANQNLRGTTSPEVLIIVHPDFLEQANRLANFRNQHDGYDVLAATTSEVFNEFSSGSQDPSAIRDIAKYYYDQGSLKHLLLFGKCSYDFKDIRTNNKNFVPTYPSRNSLHPLKTYSSDDYFGFLENNEGEWEESSAGDHTLDIGVGRLPVTTAQQAEDVVNKLINYNSSPSALGKWRNKVLFVADDGELSASLHHKQADQLSVFADTTYSSFNTRKIYLDSYEQVSKSSGVEAPKVEEAINSAIEEGALIVNYTGHGGVNRWAQEGILDRFMIDSWTNKHKLPLFVTATCEFGRHDDPSQGSGGERTVLNPNGGAIAIVTTGRPVNSGSNFLLNKAFYQSIFKKIGGRYPTLGEVMMDTKNNSLNGSSNRNFSLLGDPSMTLTYPDKDIIIDEITTATSSNDTIKALSKVKIHGFINDAPNFKGLAQITVFDKQSPAQTLGNENPVYHYSKWDNIIFQGYSSVTNGNFNAEFIVPKNINYEIGQGKISVYAIDDERKIDAGGANTKVTIGGSENISTMDETSPEIFLYINDTIPNNRIIGSNILLYAKLTDESGISISNYGIGGGIEGVLDDSISFDLSQYYNATKDSFQTGWVLFPVDDLSTGKHAITVTASDTQGNPSSEIIQFYVNASELIISKIYNYPNPVNSETTFGFTHNFSGDHLEINFTLYTPSGGVVMNQIQSIANIDETVEFAKLNIISQNGHKLEPGIYIYGIEVRSLTKGVKNRKFQKLIITN